MFRIVLSSDLRSRVMSSNPSISGIPRSTTRTCGLTSAIRSSAVIAEFKRSDLRTGRFKDDAKQVERILFVVDCDNVNSREVPESSQGLSSLGARMFAPHFYCVRVDNHERQPYAEGGAFALAGARCFHGAAVHLDNMSNNGQAQSEAARLSRCPCLGLTKPLEYVGKKVRLDAHAGVADDYFDVGVDALEAHLHAPFLRREFHRVRYQIPDNLLQTAWVARHRAHSWIHQRLNPYPFRVGGGLDSGDCVVDD